MALVQQASHTRLRVDGTISIRELQSTVAQVLVLAESSDIIGLLRRLKGITWKTHPKPRQVEKLTFLTLEFLKLCPNGKISQPKLRTALLLENRHTRGPIFLSTLPDDIEADRTARIIRMWLGKYRMMKGEADLKRVILEAVFPGM